MSQLIIHTWKDILIYIFLTQFLTNILSTAIALRVLNEWTKAGKRPSRSLQNVVNIKILYSLHEYGCDSKNSWPFHNVKALSHTL